MKIINIFQEIIVVILLFLKTMNMEERDILVLFKIEREEYSFFKYLKGVLMLLRITQHIIMKSLIIINERTMLDSIGNS